MTPKAPSNESLEGTLGEGTVLNMGTAVVLAYSQEEHVGLIYLIRETDDDLEYTMFVCPLEPPPELLSL